MAKQFISTARALWLGGALALAACGNASTEEQDSRPNIVLVIVDDQRYDAFGALTPTLETPNLDRMLNEGVRFENGFVTTSLCSPSRASIMSGQTMRNHGIVDNNSPTPEDFEPFSVLLDATGYDTAFVGKWHMGNADNTPKPGFDHWVSFEGQGTYAPVSAFGQPTMLNVDGTEVPQQGYITQELTDYATDWLAQRDDDPFLLILSHKAVHLPFVPAEKNQEQYADEPFPLPASADPAARQGPRPMWLTSQNNSWHGTGFAFYSDRSIGDLQRQYYRTLSGVDDSTGVLLDTLAAAPNDRETVLIYTSDNGFMFGEQGLVDKRAAYEASIRVPMVFHAPGLLEGGTVSPIMARNIDIAPTVLALAGIEQPTHYDGRDILSVDPATDDAPFVYEYYWEFNYPQTPTTFAVRTNQYKYIQYHGVWDTEELFDLKADPEELTNLVTDPDYQPVLIDMRARLFAELSGESTPTIPFTERFNQGAVFWSDDVSTGVDFPPHWQRDAASPDKYEHVIPDGPQKPAQLQAITPAVRTMLDGPEEPNEEE